MREKISEASDDDDDYVIKLYRNCYCFPRDCPWWVDGEEKVPLFPFPFEVDEEAVAVETELFKWAGGAVDVEEEDGAKEDPFPLPPLPFPDDDVGVFGDWRKEEWDGDVPLLRVDEVDGELGPTNEEEGRGDEGSPQTDPLPVVPVFRNCVWQIGHGPPRWRSSWRVVPCLIP